MHSKYQGYLGDAARPIRWRFAVVSLGTAYKSDNTLYKQTEHGIQYDRNTCTAHAIGKVGVITGP